MKQEPLELAGVGPRIRAIRRRKGMSQQELAERVGVRYSAISQWERELSNPTTKTINRLADALGVTVSDLLGIDPPIDTGNPLASWAERIHINAVDHGWWDEPRSFGEVVALCHSELSEALEEYRAGRPMEWYACTESEGGHPCGPKDETECYYFGREETCKYHGEKPEGIAVEMIDCLIRILDWCGREGVDVDGVLARKHEYNKTRPYRHGGKAL